MEAHYPILSSREATSSSCISRVTLLQPVTALRSPGLPLHRVNTKCLLYYNCLRESNTAKGFMRVLIAAFVCLGCGGVLYGDHGSFSSPNYPGTYANGTSCEWRIRAPSGRVVTVTFNQISIDDPGDCENNYLKLYDGPDANSPVVGPYCGTVCVKKTLLNILPIYSRNEYFYQQNNLFKES